MKLYTEQQLEESYKRGLMDGRLNNIDYSITDGFKPIELPSDEEIEDKGKWIFNNAGHTIFTHYNTVPSWVEGAKWMRNKILNK